MFTTLVGIVFVGIYALTVHWVIAPAYFLTVPILGWLSSTLSKKIKVVQKVIVAETTALAGSTTESLRNIELVKSLGLARQEVARLNAATAKILKLELKKVRYLRSLSFIQGTAVNALRTSLLFLMLYLIFARQITVGQFFSLWIYSFFIFGPLQELGNVINTYRETEVSLKNFQDILDTPREPRPAQAVAVPELSRLAFEDVTFRHQTATAPAVDHISFQVAQGETIGFVGPSGSGKTTLVKLLVGLYRPQEGRISYDGVGHTEIDLDSLREQIGFVTQETQLFSGSIRENLLFVRPEATDAEVMDALDKAACQSLLTARGQGPRHADRRGRRQGLGRRAPAPRHRPRPPAPSAPARVRRGDVGARLADRGGDQPHHPRRGEGPRGDDDPDRPPPLDGDARGPHPRAGARAARRVRPARPAARREGPLLRDVAAAGGRAAGKRRGSAPAAAPKLVTA